MLGRIQSAFPHSPEPMGLAALLKAAVNCVAPPVSMGNCSDSIHVVTFHRPLVPKSPGPANTAATLGSHFKKLKILSFTERAKAWTNAPC